MGRRRVLASALSLGLALAVASPGAAQEPGRGCEPGPHPSGFGVVFEDCSAKVTEAELLGVNTLISEQMERIDKLAAELAACQSTQLAEVVKCRGDRRTDARALNARIFYLEGELTDARLGAWRSWWADHGWAAALVAGAAGVAVGVVLTLELAPR